MLTFDSFQSSFLNRLTSKDFGALPYSNVPGAESPTTKEFKRKNAYEVFSGPLLLEIYGLLSEHARLINEQSKIFAITDINRPTITKLRNARRTIAAIGKKLKAVKENTGGLIDAGAWSRICKALKDFDDEVRDIQWRYVTRLHPAERKSDGKLGRWDSILKLYNYEFPTLKKKTPDQWLYDALDSLLIHELAQLKISAITRYRIMSALLSTYGMEVAPSTFKLRVRSRKSVNKSSVKKS